MERIIERCAALDIHRDSLTACARVPDDAGGRRQETCAFPTTTAGLLALADWLRGLDRGGDGVDRRLLARGLFEDEFECWLLNARHLRNVPGRKTDVEDAEWICRLVEHGLVRPSFVPPRPLRELRDLTRYRKAKIQERTREVQRLEKALQDAGIKLSSVASKVLGASGRAMLDALVAGTHDPDLLADLAKGALRKKLPALREALQGRFSGHHAVLVAQMLAQIDFIDETVATLSERIEELTAPFSREIEPLDSIPGVDGRTAELLIAEIGADTSRFPSPGTWPRGPASAPASTSRRASNAQARPARAPNRCAPGSPNPPGRRAHQGHLPVGALPPLKSRRGHAKATVATAHKILTAAYHVLDRGLPYDGLGEDFFYCRDAANAQRYRRRLVRQLERLGHKVTLEPLPDAA